MYKLKKKIIIIVTLFMVILIGCIGFSCIFNNFMGKPLDEVLKLFGILGIILLAWSLYSWWWLTNQIISPFIIYLVISYIFLFGQSLLAPFELINPKADLALDVSLYSIINAQIFTLICLGMFFLGGVIVVKKNELKGDRIYNSKKGYKAIYSTGMVFLIISMLPYFIYMFDIILKVSKYGYMGMYNYSGEFNISSLPPLINIYTKFRIYYLPSLMCLLIACKSLNMKKRELIVIGLLSLDIVSKLYIGLRGDAMIIIIVIICIYNYYDRKLKVRQMLVLIMFGYIALFILAVIKELRVLDNKTLMDYFNLIKDSLGKENLAIKTISEMGWSMFPLCKVMEIVPEIYDYDLGRTYIMSFTSLIPNLGFWEVHPSHIYAHGPSWLMKVLNMSYGPGFSVVAEAYKNFGYLGWIVQFIFGMLYAYILEFIDIRQKKATEAISCTVLIFFMLNLTNSRDSFLPIIGDLFKICLPIYILIKLFDKGMIPRIVYKK